MKTKTKQTAKTGTESDMDITWRVFSGEGEGKNWGRRYREKKGSFHNDEETSS